MSSTSNPNARILLANRYELGECIGRGGMADVYAARDQRLHRAVAVKLLAGPHADDPATVQRFQREAQAVATLTHPNVVAIYDYGTSEGTPFLVMERVAGPDLREHLRRVGPLPEEDALALTAQIASALEAAHARGVVHRDIKPGNVILDADGRAKVADFGIARSLNAGDVTQTASLVGTAHYLAPEQVQGQPADSRSDLYSLGVVLYELLLGEPPFRANSPVAVALQHVHADLPDPSAGRPDLSPETVRILRCALEKDPELRFQTAAELRKALEAASSAGRRQLGRPTSSAVRIAAWTRYLVTPPRVSFPHRVVVAGCLAVAALVLLPSVWLLSGGRAGSSAAATATTANAVAVAVSGTTLGVSPRVAGAPTAALVPDVAGQSVGDARAALEAAGLKVQTREESTLDAAAGTVVTQEPHEGQHVLPGTTVELLVSAGVQVPDLVGRKCAEARAELGPYGWSVKPVRWRIANIKDFGNVVQQDPPAGTVVAEPGQLSVQVAGPVRPC